MLTFSCFNVFKVLYTWIQACVWHHLCDHLTEAKHLEPGHHEPLKLVMQTADPHLGFQLKKKATRKLLKKKNIGSAQGSTRGEKTSFQLVVLLTGVSSLCIALFFPLLRFKQLVYKLVNGVRQANLLCLAGRHLLCMRFAFMQTDSTCKVHFRSFNISYGLSPTFVSLHQAVLPK